MQYIIDGVDSFMKNRRKMRLVFYIMVIVTISLLMVGWWTVSCSNINDQSERFIAIGRLFGLLAAWCVLLEVILMSRTPFIESSFDPQDQIDLHRLNGYGILLTILGHIVFLAAGYAYTLHINLWDQFIQFNTQYSDVIWATIGVIMLFGAVAISIRAIKKLMKYEIWYILHLTIYVSILLEFLHQIKTGGDFAHSFVFIAYWYTLYIFTFLVWVVYRVYRPLATSFIHKLKIAEINRLADNIYSVTITGQNIDRISYKSGQYAAWRILAPGLWFETHPFSISSIPHGSTLQFTFKVMGDFTEKLSLIRTNPYVIFDGPRGNFSYERANNPNVTIIAGGIGITPYITMIQPLIESGKKVTLFYAIKNRQEIAFTDELNYFKSIGLKIYLFISSEGWRINEGTLIGAAKPNTTLYICGPDRMSRPFTKTLKKAGVKNENIIVEYF